MITIIGGGPAGNYLGSLLAKKEKVRIIEEHKAIGKPIQCTGLLTSKINGFIDLPKGLIINKIKKVKIFSKRSNLTLNLKNPNLVVERQKLDMFLAEKAKDSGAEILTGSRFIGYKNNKVMIKGKKPLSSDILIGADGPLSKVSQLINTQKNRHLIGIQVRAKIDNNNILEFYPHIGSFAWCVPEDKDIVRIGIASQDFPNKVLTQFLRHKHIKRSQIIEYQGGLIPIYNPGQTMQKDSIYLIGDAASQVKATTGGGIIPSFKAAQALSCSIDRSLSYKKQLKGLNRQLNVHLLMRNVMDKLSGKEWDRLIDIFNNPKNKKILENIDRDNIVRLFFHLIKEPKLYRFAKYLV